MQWSISYFISMLFWVFLVFHSTACSLVACSVNLTTDHSHYSVKMFLLPFWQKVCVYSSMNFQSVVRLFHFHHCKNTGQNISDMLVLLLREFEIAFSLWQQYSETWMLLKSATSRAAGGRLCTTCKALVISHIFNKCQINKKQTKPTKPPSIQKQLTNQTTPLPPKLILHLLRTVACWNLISLLYRRWT